MCIISTFEIAWANMVRYNIDPDIFEELDASSANDSRLNGASMKSINKTYGSDDSIHSEGRADS